MEQLSLRTKTDVSNEQVRALNINQSTRMIETQLLEYSKQLWAHDIHPPALQRITRMAITSTINKRMLSTMLREHFNLPVTITEYSPMKLALQDDTKIKLKHYRLGTHRMLGEYYFTHADAIHFDIGPLNNNQYRACLPSGKKFQAIINCIRHTLKNRYHFTIDLLLDSKALSPTVLKQNPHLQTDTQLGHTTWLPPSEASILRIRAWP